MNPALLHSSASRQATHVANIAHQKAQQAAFQSYAGNERRGMNATIFLTIAAERAADALLAEALEQFSDGTLTAEIPSVNKTRETVFAAWTADEYLTERKLVEEKVTSQPGFNDLSISEQIAELRALVVSSGSPRLVGYGLALALNWLANATQIQNPVLLIVFLLVMIAADSWASRQWIADARKAARGSPETSPNSRIVDHSCDVLDSPNRNCRRIARLQSGMIVEVAEKFSGWCKVTFFDVDSGQNQVGWARSKYLKKL